MSVEVLEEAVSRRCQVEFQYMEYGMDKRLHPRREQPYRVSPYGLCFSNGNYYLLCRYQGAEDISHYRVDRIQSPVLLEGQPIEPLPPRLDLERYVRERVYPFPGEAIRAVLRCEADLLSDVLDRFGFYTRSAKLVYLTKNGSDPSEWSRMPAGGTDEERKENILPEDRYKCISWEKIYEWLGDHDDLDEVKQFRLAIQSFWEQQNFHLKEQEKYANAFWRTKSTAAARYWIFAKSMTSVCPVPPWANRQKTRTCHVKPRGRSIRTAVTATLWRVFLGRSKPLTAWAASWHDCRKPLSV